MNNEQIIDQRYKYNTLNTLVKENLNKFIWSRGNTRILIEILSGFKNQFIECLECDYKCGTSFTLAFHNKREQNDKISDCAYGDKSSCGLGISKAVSQSRGTGWHAWMESVPDEWDCFKLS